MVVISAIHLMARADTARYTLANEPPTLDWNLATDNVSYRILNDLMEGLTQFDEHLRPAPALAVSWELQNQGKTYVFHLNPEAKWSDGKPLTAQHFVDSWIRLLSPETGAEYAYFLFDIQGAKDFNAGHLKDPRQVGIRATGPHELQVTLLEPRAYFPAITTFMVTYPIRLDLLEKYGREKWTEAGQLVTLGPYQLKSWRHEYKIVLEKNRGFYGMPKPSIETVEIFFINDATVALSLYETGVLDFVELPPIAIPHFRNHSEFSQRPKLRGFYFGINVQKTPFQNPKVRQAFGHAVNRSDIPKILQGGEIPTASWIPQGLLGYNATLGLNFDPERARRLLAEAGFPNGNGFPKTHLAFNTDGLNKLMAEFFQAQIKTHLGVDLILDNQEWKVYLKNLQMDPPPLFRMGWGADYPDPDNFMNLFTSTSGNNYTRWKSRKFDALILAAARASNPKQRERLYTEAQQILCVDEAAILPMFIATTSSLARAKFQNLFLTPLGYISWKRVRALP